MTTGTNLQDVEAAILESVQKRGTPISVRELVQLLGPEIDEATLRQALWRLMDRSQLRLNEHRQFVAA